MTSAASVPERTSGVRAIGSGILLSRIVGLIRQRAIGHFLGVGDAADVLSAALRIPNSLQTLLGDGVLSASFVPVYARLRAEGRAADAARVARAVFATLAVACAIVVAAGVLAAPALVAVIAAGFAPAKRDATVLLVRILFPGMGVLVLSAWCLGVLNAHRAYFIGYAAPIAWNVAIIAALLAGADAADPAGAARLVAIGSVVGSVLQVAVQLPALFRVLPKGVAPGVTVSPELRLVGRNFVPVLFGRGVVQISAWIDQLVASFLTGGAASVLLYAQNIALLPVSVFGMSVSVSELTEMAGQETSSVAATIRGRMEPALRRVAFFVVPSATAFIVLGDIVAATILESGSFRRHDAIWVWAVLAGAGVGLVAGTMGRVYNSAWYAMHDTRTPLTFALIRILIAASLGATAALVVPNALGIEPRWGVAGITLASSIGAWVEYRLLRRALNARIGVTGLPPGLLSRLWMAAVVASGAGLGTKGLLVTSHPVAQGAAVFTAYGAVYLAVTAMMGLPEPAAVLRTLRRRSLRGRP